MLSGRSRKHRLRSRPAHSWTPMMPKMKKTKKQSSSTLPSIGSVSSSSITRIRIPAPNTVAYVNIANSAHFSANAYQHQHLTVLIV